MVEVIIPNKKELENKIKKMSKDGKEKLHVLADFDNTLTKAFVNGKKTPSVVAVLRTANYLSEEYSKEANALAEKYRPIEHDHSIPMVERKKAMFEWWTKHFELLIRSKLNKNNLKRVIDEGNVEFREGTLDLLDFLHKNKIPLVIMSSSGIGDLIPMFLEKNKRLYDNIHIITNLYEWDSKGNAIRVKPPVMHIFNKDETIVKNFPNVYDKIKERKNVIVLGDSIGDLGMIKGFDFDNLIQIGFLNEDTEKNLNLYKENFDVVITDDGPMDYVNAFLRDLEK